MATTPQLEPVHAAPPQSSRRKHTREEMLAIFRAAREEVQAHNPEGRDILAEFMAERREAGARGE
jgi:cytochrome P450